MNARLSGSCQRLEAMNLDADPNVSNGTCYSTENTEAIGNFIPCGNVALGHWPCCHAGDFCLSFDDANACWDLESKSSFHTLEVYLR